MKKKSFKTIYPEILRKVEPFLEARYDGVLKDRSTYYQTQQLEHHRSRFIWFCWLQGFDNAPRLVHICYDSLRHYLPDWEIKIIDGSNWREYVELPEYIVRKWELGRIPPANFSDLLRLELLIRYGGTWIDSTVLCTGPEHIEEYLDADLFLFQYTPQGTTSGISISNWFITACTSNEVLMVLRDMLHAYWKDYDCTLNYYIFHQFFSLVAREYPDQVASMPYGSSQRSIALMRHWGERFNQDKWDRLVGRVSFHKLSYRVNEKTREGRENYYSHIITTYGSR